MKIARINRKILCCLVAVCILCACEDDDKKPFDYGDNNKDLYVAMGDSITAGIEEFSGTPYPDQLAQMLGKTVINEGVDGAFSYQGAAMVDGILAEYKPGHLMVLYGANDLIWGADLDGIVGELRKIVIAAKNNKTMVAVATLPPMTRHAMHFYDATLQLNTRIRAMVAEEGVRLADLEPLFIGRESELLPDGLHPNEEGNRLIAQAFYKALK